MDSIRIENEQKIGLYTGGRRDFINSGHLLQFLATGFPHQKQHEEE